MQENINVEKVLIEGRKKLSVSNVESVDGFTSQWLKLTVSGSTLLVTGENIKITAFNKANGNLTADGNFLEVKYNHKKQPLLKRLFK
ncbi:MAG: YabP/YqfC family sporulation protein [Clostridia bacterium]|nr:YabP/YqfC family sporulation protein [Clostridia bacterium]